jgi:anti-sigma factor RsiW
MALGRALAQEPVEAEQLEPPHQVGSHGHGHHPVGVGLEVGKGHAAETGVLQPLDVLFDVGVGPHGGVQLVGGALGVGVEAPVAELETREQAALGPGVEGLPPDDKPGPLGELLVIDQRGQLADGAIGVDRTRPRHDQRRQITFLVHGSGP